MEPIYIYIIVLSYIACRLIFDSTFRKAKANRMLMKYIKMNEEAKDLLRESEQLQREILDESFLDNAADFIKKNRIISQHIIQYSIDIENLEAEFRNLIDGLPKNIAIEFDMQLFYLKFQENQWVSKKDAKHNYNKYLYDTTLYVAAKFNPVNRPMLELAYEFSKDIGEIKCNDGEIIHTLSLRHMLDKWELNEKLQTSLPPRKKTKVVKI